MARIWLAGQRTPQSTAQVTGAFFRKKMARTCRQDTVPLAAKARAAAPYPPHPSGGRYPLAGGAARGTFAAMRRRRRYPPSAFGRGGVAVRRPPGARLPTGPGRITANNSHTLVLPLGEPRISYPLTHIPYSATHLSSASCRVPRIGPLPCRVHLLERFRRSPREIGRSLPSPNPPLGELRPSPASSPAEARDSPIGRHLMQYNLCRDR